MTIKYNLSLILSASLESWKFVAVDGRVYLEWRMPLSGEPKMIIRRWRARGYQEYYPDSMHLLAVTADGSGLVGPFRTVPLDQGFRKTEPDETVEEPIKAPRGKWRWRYGRWRYGRWEH